MKTKHTKNRHEDPHSVQKSIGYDPLQAVRVQSSSFNIAWLKNGESLLPIQRVGYGVFSLGFIGIGIFCGMVFWQNIQSGDLMFILWGVATLFFLGFGGLGLRNAFRFRHAKH